MFGLDMWPCFTKLSTPQHNNSSNYITNDKDNIATAAQCGNNTSQTIIVSTLASYSATLRKLD
jgi:hypothetical protein